jgi:hypothetical protein
MLDTNHLFTKLTKSEIIYQIFDFSLKWLLQILQVGETDNCYYTIYSPENFLFITRPSMGECSTGFRKVLKAIIFFFFSLPG